MYSKFYDISMLALLKAKSTDKDIIKLSFLIILQ